METYPSLARSAGSLRVTLCVTSDCGTRRAAACLQHCEAGAEPRAIAGFRRVLRGDGGGASRADGRQWKTATATAAMAAMADLVVIMLLPELSWLRGLRPQ